MTYEEMYALLSNLPENRLPAAPDVSLEEKRQQLLTKDVYKKYLAQMSDRAEQYRAEPAAASPFSAFKLFETTGDRVEYNKYYFSNRGRMATFALMTWLYGREEDIHALEDALWAVCDEYTWCLPPHLAGTGLTKVQNGNHIIDLFAAETACAIGEILALVGEKLAPIVVKRARHLVQERVLERFLQVECNWEHAKSNWAAVCAGSVGIAAFYEAKDPEQLARITHRLQGAIESYVSSFPADGTSMEGISYWTYGFSFFASYAEMLLRMTKGAIDWFKDERVRQVALFQQKAYFENYNIIKFADCGKSDTAHWWGLTSYLKSRFDEIEFLPRDYYTDYPGDPYYRWAPLLRDLVWSDDTYPANNKSEKCYIQPDAQWLICNSKTGIGMAAKGGSNDETHNHNDVGHLQLFKNGDEVLADCGSGNYTRDYFGPNRYNLFITGSQGHSVPVVDGCYQKAGAEYRAADVSFGEWFMEMDIAPAYGLENLRSLRRRIAFERETGKVELTDTYDFSAPAVEIIERFISYSEPAFEEGKAILTGPKSVTTLCFDPVLKPSVTVENPARAGNNSDVAGKPVYVLDFKAKKPETKCTFTFTIV